MRTDHHDGVSRLPRRVSRPFIAGIVIGFAIVANASELNDRKERTYADQIVLFGATLAADPMVSTIQTLNPATSELGTVLEIHDGLIGDGRISPDRSQFAFSVRPAETNRNDIWLLSPIGEPRKLAVKGHVAAWSPDGTRLACFDHDESGFRSFILDVASETTVPIDIPHTDVVDDWSPRDDETVTVIAGHPERTFGHPTKGTYPLRQIELLNLSDGRRSPLTTDANQDSIWSRFSGDGSRIVHYRRHPENVPRIFEFAVVRTGDGLNARDLLRFGDLDEHRSVRPLGPPCWSPDGSRIAWGVTFRQWDETEQLWDLLIIPVDERPARRLEVSKIGVTGWAGIDWR